MLLKVTRFALFGLCAGLAGQSLLAADPATGRVLQYRAESGETSFALVLEPKQIASPEQARDHVVLFDTSASQTGEHRQQALAVLDSFLKSLPTTDRVRLFGVDVSAKEMTNGFAAVGSAELRQGYEKLLRREPLGATNLQRAISTALDSLDADKAATIAYLGDGMSSLKLLADDELRAVVDGLRARRVPFNSYAVGPRRDLPLLGTLATWTGGSVTLDEGDNQSAKTGVQFAKVATAAVFYPSQMKVVPASSQIFPLQALPIRGDRETVLLGKGKVPQSITVELAGQSVNWDLSSAKVIDDQAFVSPLVQRVEQQALHLPFAGQRLLDIAKSDFAARVNQLTLIGDAALFDHDMKRAEAAGKAIREMDPQNEAGTRLLTSSRKFKTKLVAYQDDQAAPQDGDKASTSGATKQESGALISQIEAIQEIRTQQMLLQVNSAIEQARAMVAEDPDAAIGIIKKSQGAVTSAQDINPDVRLNMLKRLQGVRADIQGQKDVQEQRAIRRQEAVAAIEAQRRLISQIQLDDERMEQLIDRVRSLLEEAKRGNPSAYGEAESVANVATNLRPENGTTTAAKVGAVAARQLYVAYYLRALRADRFLETLEQVERSHVAFPDEPPVRWPAPEVWRQLTISRKQYASVDLHKSSAAEKRIIAALDDLSSVQFTEQPLQVAIDFIKAQHEIEILLDKATLEAAGVTTDTPVTLNLAGIPLRSVLNIMLKDLNLTYVIQNDVMVITTVEEAQNRLQTRVYPVGDLVLDLDALSLGGLGGGGLGGQFGGGGGLGGGGLGGQQQQGGGGGGGFFNVPAAVRPQAVQRRAPVRAGRNAAQPVAPARAENAQPVDAKGKQLLNGILKDEASLNVTAPFAGMAQVQDGVSRDVKKKP